MNTELEVVWDGTQRHPITGSRGGLTTYPTREFGGRDLPAIEAEAWREFRQAQRPNRVGHPGIERGERNAQMVRDAVALGYVTAQQVAAHLGMTRRLAAHYLQRLVMCGQVRQARGATTGKGFKVCTYEVTR